METTCLNFVLYKNKCVFMHLHFQLFVRHKILAALGAKFISFTHTCTHTDKQW